MASTRLIGLTGGIATGKSTFAAALQACGAPIIDADRLARAAVAPGTPGLDTVIAAFGSALLTRAGELDRAALGRLVFSDPAARARLESMLHPTIRALFAAERDRLCAEGHPVILYDVPLLYESHLEAEVDLVTVVWAPRALQISRLMARNGLDREAAEARLAAQLPIDEKAERADVLIVNDADVAALSAKAPRFLADVASGLARKLPNASPARY